MLKRLLAPGVLFLCLLLAGCAAETFAPIAVTPMPTAAEEPAPTAELTPPPTPTPSPAPEPTPQAATVGFAGDVLIMQTQVRNAEQADGTYDFSGSFAPMESVFAETDVVCVNFEGAMAGEAAGYSEPRPTAPPPTEADPAPRQPYQTFNAPDALARDLAEAGVDFVSTANNHCLDRGYAGLLRTAQTLRAAGLLQGGGYLSEEDRFTPRILMVNGIRIGLVCATESVNRNDALIPSESRDFAVSRLSKEELLAREIASCREAGAEFIIAFVHWGNEFEAVQNSRQEKTAQWLVSAGADAVVGSHPHVVQPIEWIEAERGGELVRAPVVYSLGNFVSNMSKPDTDYGMYVRLRLMRGSDGAVSCTAVEYLPVLCIRQKLQDGRTLHQAVPCYADASLTRAAMPLDGDALEKAAACYAHVTGTVGTEQANLIEWSGKYAQ